MVRLGAAVAPGASDLLVVGFEAARQRGVDHGAHVGLVDAHAERDGGDHHFDAAIQELLLHALAVLGIEAGVVGGAGEVVGKFGGRLRWPARASGCRRWPGGARSSISSSRGECGALRGRDLHHFDGEVVAAETRG